MFVKSKIFEQANKVEINNNEFEQYFDIYSSNQALAAKLLTDNLIEILVSFHNQYGLEYEIVLKNDFIYTRFFTGAMFEHRVFGNSMNK